MLCGPMSRMPSKEELLKFIAQNPNKSTKRDITRAFHIKGAAKVELRDMLRALRSEGHLPKRHQSDSDSRALPPVTVLIVTGPDDQGDLFAEPAVWKGKGDAPRILVVEKRQDPSLAKGDRILAHIANADTPGVDYEGRIIRKIGSSPQEVLGLYRTGSQGGRIVPIDKKSDREWRVDAGGTLTPSDGELVQARQIAPRGRMGLPLAEVTAVLGDPMAPKSVSLYAIHAHGIPDEFPEAVLSEASAINEADTAPHEDLTAVPFVTIDPSDARDHDDAIYAEADPDAKNPGGHVVWVAIADVAAFVRPGTALDREAVKRGNSTYFPDRVVPMLPDRLSGDLCSLHEGAVRPAIVLRMTLDAEGRKIAHRFKRATIKSRASLNYVQTQAAEDGHPDDQTSSLREDVISPLFAAYRALSKARDHRQPLHLDLPERRIELSEDGRVTSVAFKDRLDAHKLVEECMILANVCAAETLEQKKTPLLYRVHEEPSPEKLEALRKIAEASGLTLAKGQVLKTRHLNGLLDASQGTENAEIINMAVLRSMTQAYYAAQNFGHFGLALRRYAHFTSPIRRYADLLVHRALISAHGWGEDGLSEGDIDRLEETAVSISQTERRSMQAERDTNDRYLSAFLSERIGNEFEGRISGVARFGLFARLDETGADGLIPIRSLGREYFRFDEDAQTLRGENSGVSLKPGQRVTVRLSQAEPVTGGILLELLALEGKPLPKGPRGKSKRITKRKLNVAKKKRVKARKSDKNRPR